MSEFPNRSKQARAVPTGRLARLGSIGSLATGIAGGMLAEGARQLGRGRRPTAREMMLTPANIQRLTDQLAKLRGAAMKIGQLLSMEAGELLPHELTVILARLRSQAEPMPFSQLSQTLEQTWGAQWSESFRQFSFQPFAAASIGQVHRARSNDGKGLAIKVQYPGIADSIDADVDNVAALLKFSGLVPAEVQIDNLLAEAKKQLHAEADYLLEADWIRRYRARLRTGNLDAKAFVLPEVEPALTRRNILVMSHETGKPLEQIGTADASLRNYVVEQLFRLFFRELFEFRMVQTDPNFANFLVREETRQLVLLDFGATRCFGSEIAAAYRALMLGALAGDRGAVEAAASSIGFFRERILPEQRQAVTNLFMQACEPLVSEVPYDFAGSRLAARIADAGMDLSMQKNYWHTPPADAIFLHRKLAGLYLVAARLRARISLRELFMETVNEVQATRSPEYQG